MRRRSLLAAPLALPWWLAAPALARAETGPQRLATSWRVPGVSAPDSGFRTGVMNIDWAAGQVQMHSPLSLPSRAHGLVALPDGGFVTVANRPGHWLLRCDATGALVQGLDATVDTPPRSLNGHVEASADGQWLHTTETDPTTGAGWLSVRDARTLQRVAQCRSGGIDPHDLRLAADGSLLVANGGIVRDAAGRKIDSAPMEPSLARIAPANGSLLGRWTVPDPQLSIRHLAWSRGPTALLGLALQAEHAQADERASAPVLAVWDGQALTLPCRDDSAAGYAGDIATGPAGGFVISAQRQGQALWWHPGEPRSFTRIAQLTEPCALLPSADGAGVEISAARGLARWHLEEPPRMLPWPVPMAPDNHWVRLAPV
jgi:uncharacterized protein